MNNSKPDTRQLLQRIAKLSSEAGRTVEETREVLSEAGADPDEITARVLQLVTRLKKESPFHWKAKANAKRQELLGNIKAKIAAEVADLNRPQLLQKLTDAIRRLPSPAAAQYGVAFRRFEDATEEDLRSMIEEVAIIEDLEREP
jgi:DNA-binding transcriptional MerR regulator